MQDNGNDDNSKTGDGVNDDGTVMGAHIASGACIYRSQLQST